MKELFIKDFYSYFKSKFAYAVLFIYAAISLICSFYLGNFFEIPTNNLFALFYFQPNVLSFLLPAIAIKLFTEERRTNTVELLLSQPIDFSKIVMAKFLACSGFGFLMLLSTIPFLIFSSFFINIDYSSVLTSYFATALTICLISAISCLVASLFISAAISYLASLFVIWILFFAGFPDHFLSILYGQIGIDNLAYFALISFFAIRINIYLLQNKFVINKSFVLFALLQVILSIVIIIIFNLVFSAHKFDFSHSKSFSLSKASKQALLEYKEPVSIELYASDFSDADPNQHKYLQNVKRLLSQIPNSTLTTKDTKPFSPQEDDAIKYNFEYITKDNYNFYSGILISLNNKKIALTSLAPQDANYLELDVIRAISSLHNKSPKTIGIISGNPQVINKEYGFIRGADWPFISELKKHYTIVGLPTKISQIPNGVDILLVLHQPKSVLLKYAIDQYIMHGGKVLILENNIEFGYKNKKIITQQTELYDGDFTSEFSENIIKDQAYKAKMRPHLPTSINKPALVIINENIHGDNAAYNKKDMAFLLNNLDYLSDNLSLLQLAPKKDVIEEESIKDKIANGISKQYITKVQEINDNINDIKSKIYKTNLKADSSPQEYKYISDLQKQIELNKNKAKEIAYYIDAHTAQMVNLYILLNVVLFPLIYILALGLIYLRLRRLYVKI